MVGLDRCVSLAWISARSKVEHEHLQPEGMLSARGWVRARTCVNVRACVRACWRERAREYRSSSRAVNGFEFV